jgi:exodeoxyribonuclease VII small subunit
VSDDYPANYEAARAELREIVGKLEAGGQSLEDSLALWERGEALADICARWLEGASAKLDEAIKAHDEAHDTAGDVGTGPESAL